MRGWLVSCLKDRHDEDAVLLQHPGEVAHSAYVPVALRPGEARAREEVPYAVSVQVLGPTPRRCSSSCTRRESVVFPEPESPVNHSTPGRERRRPKGMRSQALS